MKKTTSGFTIVELLIVIVVVAILAAISVVAYTGIQQRARDSKRVNDIAQIKRAFLAYDAVHGGVVQPGATGYTKPAGEPAFGGWDVSSSANWLLFLRASHGDMPVDPVNDSSNTGGATSGNNRLYSYYCYNAGDGNTLGLPDSASATLRYRSDSGALVIEKIRVSSCLTALPN